MKIPVLIAMPSLNDSVFSKSVILLAEDTEDGAYGFIMNVLTHLKLNEMSKNDLQIRLIFGGPVQTDFLWIMHSAEILEDLNVSLFGKISVIPAFKYLENLEEGKGSASKIMRVGFGYSGWEAGQLQSEIEKGSWWKADCPLEIIFDDDIKNIWSRTMEYLGIDPNAFIDFPQGSSTIN